ncbi:hypothetical protein KIL84_020706 [Mauremys mutica]|uniref:Uncharacterized protein n=1 Tax=Mauremys mutica TaxID=74926 RepID=A0A9D3X9M3_9SAUR|nr:hypothetical protein KIL84_020706 [Mauremys mutica]
MSLPILRLGEAPPLKPSLQAQAGHQFLPHSHVRDTSKLSHFRQHLAPLFPPVGAKQQERPGQHLQPGISEVLGQAEAGNMPPPLDSPNVQGVLELGFGSVPSTDNSSKQGRP